ALKASANHTAFAFSAFGTPAGRATPVLPSPDSATHWVSSANTVSSTLWPCSLASRIDQTTRAAWWQETQWCVSFHASASLTRKPRPRSMVALTSVRFAGGPCADTADGRMDRSSPAINRIGDLQPPGSKNQVARCDAPPRAYQDCL